MLIFKYSVLLAAQFELKDQDFEYNLFQDVDLIEQASKNKASLIFIPEMSLTGYVNETAKQNALYPNYSRLDALFC